MAGLFVSVDNVVEAPEKWTGPYFGPDVGQAVGSLIAGGDTLLLGRLTYETFAASFAGDTSGDPMAAQMNAFAKVVVSTTLEKAGWQNSTLVSGDVEAAVTELKQREGGNSTSAGARRSSPGCCATGCSTSCTCWCSRSWWGRAGACSRAAAARYR